MRMRDERLQGYATANTAGKQAFQTGERVAGQEFMAEQNKAKMESAERVSGAKAARTAPTVKTITDPETLLETTVVWNPNTRSWDQFQAGTAGVGGAGGVAQDLTESELSRARAQLNTEGGGDRGSDFIPFNEASEDQVIARAWENRGASAGDVPRGTQTGGDQQGVAKIGDTKTVNGKLYKLTADGPVEVIDDQKAGLIKEETKAAAIPKTTAKADELTTSEVRDNFEDALDEYERFKNKKGADALIAELKAKIAKFEPQRLTPKLRERAYRLGLLRGR